MTRTRFEFGSLPLVGALVFALPFLACSVDSPNMGDETESGDETSQEAGLGDTDAPDFGCLLDADCGQTEACVLGICNPGCADDDECGSGETCDPHGHCVDETPDEPPSKPDAPLGDLSLLDAETLLLDGENEARVVLRNSGPVDVRYRLDVFDAGVSYAAEPRVVPSGDEVELVLTVSSELLESDQTTLTANIISDAGDLTWAIRLPRRRSGHFLGAATIAAGDPIGTSDLGLNLIFNEDGTISGQSFEDQSFLWPKDLVVLGTWTEDGDVQFVLEDVVNATSSSGANSPFGREIARKTKFAGSHDVTTGRIAGNLSVEFTGIADDDVEASGTFTLNLTGAARDATDAADETAAVPMSVPLENWPGIDGPSMCDSAGPLFSYLTGTPASACTDCQGGNCSSALLCANDLVFHGYKLEQLLESDDFSNLFDDWQGCRDGGHVYTQGDDRACYDAGALTCAGFLLRTEFEASYGDPATQLTLMRTLLDQIAAQTGGGGMIAAEREIQAVLSFREPSATIATELGYVDGALALVEEPLAVISRPGYVRGLALLGLNEIHVQREDEDLLRAVDLIERYSELKMLQIRLRARQAGSLSENDRDELRHQGIWVHALAAYWKQQLDYFEVEDDMGAVASIGAIARGFREDYVSFEGSTNPYGMPDRAVPVRLSVDVGNNQTNYLAVKQSLEPLLIGGGGLVAAVLELEQKEEAFWETSFQAASAREDLVAQYDSQLIAICGSIPDEDTGLDVPDFSACGQTGVGSIADLQGRLRSASIEIDKALEAWNANEQLAYIEISRMAEILENFDEVQGMLDMHRDDMFSVMNQATGMRINARDSQAAAECQRIKSHNRKKQALKAVGALGEFAGNMASGNYAGAVSGAVGAGMDAASAAMDTKFACGEATAAADDANEMDSINSWEQGEIQVINNMIDDLLRQSSYDEQGINSRAQVRSIRVRDGELILNMDQAGAQFETTYMQLQTEMQRLVTLVQMKDRALARFDSNPSHGPQHLMARLESARRVLTLREGIYRTLFELIRAVEYEVNQESSSLRDELASLRDPDGVDGFITQCLDWSVNEYLERVGDPGTLTQEISVRDDIFGYADDLIDPITGESVSPGEQFRALLRDPRNQGAGLQGNRVITLPFTLSLSDENSLFNYNTCDSRLLQISGMIVGDFIGDNEIDLSLNRNGVAYLRRCDAVAAGDVDPRELVNEYSFAEQRTTLRAGANQFGLDANTVYAGWPVAGDNWSIEVDFNLPANTDLTLEHISDIVLRFQLDSRDVNPAGGLANYNPGCFQ